MVISELRKVQDLQALSNEVIAKLNNQAFKAVNTSLKKMVEKRALQNEDKYKALDEEIKNKVATFDFMEIAKRN